MSDYCCLTMTFRRIDLDKVLRTTRLRLRELRAAVRDDQDGRVTIVLNADCGWLDERQTLAQQGVPHYGEHSGGGDYVAAVFASDGFESCEALAVPGFGPAALIDDDGNVSSDDVADAAHYRVLLRSARAVIDEARNPT